MFHELPAWPQLTRNGIPAQFRVVRKPLLLTGTEHAVGEVIAAGEVVHRNRLRVLYEQRRIAPVQGEVPVAQVTNLPKVEAKVGLVVDVAVPVTETDDRDDSLGGYQPARKSRRR